MESSQSTPKRASYWRPRPAAVALAIAIGLLVGASLWLAGRPEASPERFDPESPVAAYQAYVEAMREGDVEEAWALLSSDAMTKMSRTDFDAMVRDSGSYGADDTVRISLVDAIELDDSATLDLEFEHVSEPGLLNDGRWYEERRVFLVKERGSWRLTNAWVW